MVEAGVGIVDVDDVDKPVQAVPDRFFAAPNGARPLAVRPSDDAIVIEERCCGARPTSTRLLLIDELSGAVLQDITPSDDRWIVDFDRTGKHSLLRAGSADSCGHTCAASLFRDDVAGSTLLHEGIISAAWS